MRIGVDWLHRTRPCTSREGGGSLAACPAPPLLHCVPWELATFAEHSFSPLTDRKAWFCFSQLHDAKAYNRMRLSRFGVSEIITAATIRNRKRASSSTFSSRHSFTTFSKKTVCTICDLHMHETHQWDAHEHHVWAVNMHRISGTDRMSGQQMHELELAPPARTRTLLCHRPYLPLLILHVATFSHASSSQVNLTQLLPSLPSLAHQSAKLQLCSARQGSTCAR